MTGTFGMAQCAPDYEMVPPRPGLPFCVTNYVPFLNNQHGVQAPESPSNGHPHDISLDAPDASKASDLIDSSWILQVFFMGARTLCAVLMHWLLRSERNAMDGGV